MNASFKEEVLELFPTPVYAVRVPNSLSTVMKYLSQVKMFEGPNVDTYGSHSENTYILNEPECNDLKEYVLSVALKFGKEVMNYGYEKYELSQTWVSHKDPGQNHTMHTHPNSLISAVLYYGDPAEGTPAIKFHKPVGGINTSYLAPHFAEGPRTSKFAFETFSVNFEPGLMVMFPSYLFHSVPTNTTDVTRRSLAMNIVPKEGLGTTGNLTELLFHKIA